MTPEEYDEYLADVKAINLKLKKHSERNIAFLQRVNHVATYRWVREWERNNTGGSRTEMGDEKFNASLRLLGMHTRLMMDILSNDELDEELAKQYFDRIAEQRQILTTP